MAMNDWNGDGQIDSFDDYAEYEGLYHSEVEGGLNQYHGDDSRNHGSGRSSSGGMTGIAYWLCFFSGIFEQALIYTIFDIEVDNVPGAVVVILWIVFSAITTVVVCAIRK